MQKALIVNDRYGTDKLNSYLESGWRVVHTCPMPSSAGGATHNSISANCLVIIQKEKE